MLLFFDEPGRNKREEVNNVLEEERESLSASNYPVSETAESTVGGRLKQKRQLINLGRSKLKRPKKQTRVKRGRWILNLTTLKLELRLLFQSLHSP